MPETTAAAAVGFPPATSEVCEPVIDELSASSRRPFFGELLGQEAPCLVDELLR